MPHKLPILEIKKKRPTIYGPFTVFRAKPNGDPFLKIEKSTWWDINGYMIQTKKYKVVFLFKRRGLG